MHRSVTLTLLACLAMAAAVSGARAQPADDQSPASQALGGNSAPGGVGAPGGSSGFGRRRAGPAQGASPGDMPELKPVEAPRQRLDPGALLCHTEDQLRQHQAAIMARLQGRELQEPAGCHIIGETVAVSVLRRDGQALTQVQLAGDTPQTGWTDSVVRDADTRRGPLR